MNADDKTEAGSSARVLTMPRALFWALCALLLVAAFVVRWDSSAVLVDGEIHLHDADTLRRLDRLHTLDEATAYPVTEEKDGHPGGTVHHWTRPMDWVIRTIEPLAASVFDADRRYEAAALVTGPLLAVLGLLALILGAARLVSAPFALLVGLVYAFNFASVDLTKIANADHQSLQQLLLLSSMVCGLLALEAKSLRWALGAGSALGAAVWVTPESMLFVYAACVFVVIASLGERTRDARFDGLRIAWAASLTVFVALGIAFEQSDFTAFEYDKVSLFQLWQLAVVLLFVVARRFLPWPGVLGIGVAGVGALALGLLPFVIGDVRASFDAEVVRMQSVDPWLRAEVVEFWGLFRKGRLDELLAMESWLVLALPLLLGGLCFCTAISRASRTLLVVLAVVTLGFEIWERKLAIWFGFVFPFVLVGGGGVLLRRAAAWFDIRELSGTSYGVLAVVLGFATVTPLPDATANLPLTQQYGDWQALCKALREAAPKHAPGGVMAPWSLGARIMYDADLPVVASNYHRNLEGILAANRFFLAERSAPEVQGILIEKKVRFIVSTYDPYFLKYGALTLGREPLARDTSRGFEVLEEGLKTAHFALREQKRLQGLVHVADGRIEKVGGRDDPVWRLWAVR